MKRFEQVFRAVIAGLIVCSSLSLRAEAADMETAGSWSFNIGGGYSPVVGGMNSQLTSGWNFTVGTGYEFTEKLGLIFEYAGNTLGIENGILDRYKPLAAGNSTDGSMRMWSLSLSPRWKFKMNRVVGGYLIGGGGYYHLNAQVTTPSLGYVPPYCDPWWGCWGGGFVEADQIIAEKKDDTGGVNAGVGFTFDFWHDVQFYVETRYHYVLVHGPNLQLLPLTAGFRF